MAEYLKSYWPDFIALGEGDVAGAGVLFEQFLADTQAWNHPNMISWDTWGDEAACVRPLPSIQDHDTVYHRDQFAATRPTSKTQPITIAPTS